MFSIVFGESLLPKCSYCIPGPIPGPIATFAIGADGFWPAGYLQVLSRRSPDWSSHLACPTHRPELATMCKKKTTNTRNPILP